MGEMFKFTEEEKAELLEMSEQLRQQMGDEYREEDAEKVRDQIESDLQENKIKRDVFGLNPILMSFQTALLELEEIGMKRDCVLSILLYNSVANESLTIEEIETEYGTSIAHIIRGLVRIHEL
jgi:GTP diphosphokinase / guanosine-3',5'-bis(diphosphate) 3'-diphosphatase